MAERLRMIFEGLEAPSVSTSPAEVAVGACVRHRNVEKRAEARAARGAALCAVPKGCPCLNTPRGRSSWHW